MCKSQRIYTFPVQPQSKVWGVATAISGSPMSDKIGSETETYVWPDVTGNLRGEYITPLFIAVAVQNDAMLHSLLAITDVFRNRRAREVEIAKEELNSILATYDVK